MDMIYMDNAATTKMSETAYSVMTEAARNAWGNPSSMHAAGRVAAKYLREARQTCADLLGADRDEIYFTAGGSESDNWAIRGGAILGREKGKMHLITSAVEHHAVLHTMKALEKEGFRVTYLPVDTEGLISPEAVGKAIGDDTCLVSIMAANNEIGTVEPVAAIGKICRERGVLFHTDAVQALGPVSYTHQMCIRDRYRSYRRLPASHNNLRPPAHRRFAAQTFFHAQRFPLWRRRLLPR